MKQVDRLCLISLCALVLTFAVSSSNVGAVSYPSQQSPPLLSLTGQILNGEILDEGAASVRVTMKFRIQIKNLGSKPALILKWEPEIIDRRIVATPTAATEDTYVFRMQSLPSNGRSPEWEKLQKNVNKPAPPTDLIRKLAPNETWTLEITDWFYIGKETNIDVKSKPWSVVRQATRVWQQLTLRLWSRDIESNADRKQLRFSRMLKRRWQKFGDLQLEDLTSEPIPIDFSAFTVASSH